MDQQIRTECKEFLRQKVCDCQTMWPLSPRDLQEILISLAGDLAVTERHLTPVALDAAYCDCVEYVPVFLFPGSPCLNCQKPPRQ